MKTSQSLRTTLLTSNQLKQILLNKIIDDLIVCSFNRLLAILLIQRRVFSRNLWCELFYKQINFAY